jgi:hypothetical protein
MVLDKEALQTFDILEELMGHREEPRFPRLGWIA